MQIKGPAYRIAWLTWQNVGRTAAKHRCDSKLNNRAALKTRT